MKHSCNEKQEISAKRKEVCLLALWARTDNYGACEGAVKSPLSMPKKEQLHLLDCFLNSQQALSSWLTSLLLTAQHHLVNAQSLFHDKSTVC